MAVETLEFPSERGAREATTARAVGAREGELAAASARVAQAQVATSPAASAQSAGWFARLDLEFARGGARTVLARRSHVGPLVVQRPFYPEGDVCHVYLVHPPGGVVGGDTLELRAQVRDGAHALITTPAATKFYRSESRIARQLQDIALGAATCEWLPQETLLFPDAYANIATRIRLSERSKFIGWEIVCYGRPASGLKYASGRAHQDFELWLNDVPVVLDHLRLDGASESMQAPFGLAGHTVLGTMFAYPADDALLELARSVSLDGDAHEITRGALDAEVAIGAVQSAGAARIACTKVDGVLVCRAVGSQADAVRRALVNIWSLIRPHVAGRAATPPRIWST